MWSGPSTTFSSDDLADTAIAATYLTDTYSEGYWNCSTEATDGGSGGMSGNYGGDPGEEPQ
jgi:hypothetical protein